jgi:uncharacterized membrane protein YfcA
VTALESLGPGVYLLIAAIAFGTAVFHSVGGFAGGLLLAICLAPIIGVKETVPVTAAAMIVSNSARIWVFRHAVSWPAFLCIFCAAAPGIVAGAIFYVILPVHHVALLLGAFLIATLPLRRHLEARRFRIGARGLVIAGLPFGLISGTTFGAGVMLAPFLLGAGLLGESLVATVAALGFGLNVTKSLVFGLSPLLTQSLAVQGVLIGICTIPGAYTGRWIVRNTPIRVHTRFLEVLVLCGAGYFLWKAATGFGWL